jgi:hypothetical protein
LNGIPVADTNLVQEVQYGHVQPLAATSAAALAALAEIIVLANRQASSLD